MKEATLDRRLHAFRPDLAAAGLRALVTAERYVEAEAARVQASVVDLKPRPDLGAAPDTQLLFGEVVDVYERKDGWAWVQNRRDGYVGYLHQEALAVPLSAEADHEVCQLSTPLLPEPKLKVPHSQQLSIGSLVRIVGQEGRYSEIEGGGWVFTAHLRPLDQPKRDYVETALMFCGLPYLWGGRSGLGLDCSALLQLSLGLAGLAIKRDSDMQEAEKAGCRSLPLDAQPKRGDLIYWKGHCAIALDAALVVNATAGPLAVVVESFAGLHERALIDSPQGLTALLRPEL